MANLGMGDTSYTFTAAKIDEVVTKKSPGNYALGHTDDKGIFNVQYVGRSDTDLKQELKTRLDAKYKRFKYSYASSPKDAFEKECQNFHDFGGSEKLDNKNPSGSTKRLKLEVSCLHYLQLGIVAIVSPESD